MYSEYISKQCRVYKVTRIVQHYTSCTAVYSVYSSVQCVQQCTVCTVVYTLYSSEQQFKGVYSVYSIQCV